MKEGKLLERVKRLVRKAGLPRFLHRMGPKTYELWQHVLALLIRELCRLSYRKVSYLLSGLGLNTPSYSALAKMLKRVPRALWNALFNATIGFRHTFIAAFDGTYYSRSSPSAHYLKRTKKKIPRTPVQVDALFDTRRKKWIAVRTRVKRVHETRDLEPLLKEAPPPITKLVVDKVADDEKIHRDLERDYHIKPYIPVRKNVVHGMYRHKHAAYFHNKTYHRRSLIETGFSKNKRTQGGSVKNHGAKTIRTEITLRYLNDNLNLLTPLLEIFNRAWLGEQLFLTKSHSRKLNVFKPFPALYYYDSFSHTPTAVLRRGRHRPAFLLQAIRLFAAMRGHQQVRLRHCQPAHGKQDKTQLLED